jgi:hypothetical protein
VKVAWKHRHRGVAGAGQGGVTGDVTLMEEPMSAVNTVSWFEIGAPDVEAAKAFYGPLFGWSFAADGNVGLHAVIIVHGAGLVRPGCGRR